MVLAIGDIDMTALASAYMVSDRSLHFRSQRFYNSPMRLRSALPALIFGLVALSACGEDGGSGSNSVPADADLTVHAVEGIEWDASEYAATATDGSVKVYGVNDSSLPHNLYVISGDSAVGDFIDLPSRGSDGTMVYDLAPGEYRIVCRIAGHDNMNSKLVVS